MMDMNVWRVSRGTQLSPTPAALAIALKARAADLMAALLKAPVSTGFVSRCLVRLDAALVTAGFEDALKDALRAADVLGTDETPAR
ncbi:MAG: hypothetical protein ACRDNF_07870 [Streptosporangiaceae bacterium]